MRVKIENYGEADGQYFIEYFVSGLSSNQLDYLHNNLSEECEIHEGMLKIKMYFDERLYPFQSDVAKIKLDDFIAREEIEMTVFLTSFLEDM
ncbi:MAG: hypothetical protein E7Z81_05660 [Methanobrevibacter sp.]|jgi:hypothetical protein|uniref:DUF5750 family protein n=1 Tax=Methanobrevibacter sp. TaxID=66852 RepID=UPI0025E23E87|nr:DUF5750 family protein [Methanobrevibacter sp.]MBE6497745.1 hypothetical protein [Methanobrevibacter sp.]